MEHVSTTSPLGPFSISGELAKVQGINIRKEGGEDERKTVIDLKIEVICDMGPVNYIDTGLRHFLWSTEGIVRNPLVGDVAYKGVIGGCRISLGGLEADGVEAKKITVSPRDSFRAVLVMSLTWGPNSTEIATLSEMLLESYPFEIEGEAALVDADPPARPKKPSPQLVLEIHGDAGEVTDDEALATARELVISSGKASISSVQRHLRIGYNRAARLLEALEKLGVVSAMQSDGSRNVTKGASA